MANTLGIYWMQRGKKHLISSSSLLDFVRLFFLFWIRNYVHVQFNEQVKQNIKYIINSRVNKIISHELFSIILRF